MTVRLAHLSDIHFGGENTAALEAAEELLERDSPDLIVITGDITSFGSTEEFRQAQAWVRRLTAPVLVTPGNHDTPYFDVPARLVAPFARYRAALGPPDGRRWAHPEAVVATVNTARGVQMRLNWSKGAIGRLQVDSALAALAGRPNGALAVVAVHHPLMEMVGGPMTARVRGGERAARRLATAGVDLILSGHIHAPFVWALPWAPGSYAVGASTLSLRERGAPAGFNLITADAKRITVAAQAWNGSALETWRTWSLDRRMVAAEDPGSAALFGPGVHERAQRLS
ncbi:MAG TPA: metallophosphoesterase [Caulobacteraceae bacterium]|nr:metallophosphoesterase [Caulobacteraceae bacterium]